MSRNRARTGTAQLVYPSAAKLLALRPTIRETVIACGVPTSEIEDATATIVLAAWQAIQAGRFRLYAGADLERVFGSWIYAISWRLSSHERGRARHRREVLSDDPWSLMHEPAGPDPDEQIAARRALRVVQALPPSRQAPLLAVIQQDGIEGLARKHGVSVRAVHQQIVRARRDLRQQVEEIEEAEDDGSGAPPESDD